MEKTKTEPIMIGLNIQNHPVLSGKRIITKKKPN